MRFGNRTPGKSSVPRGDNPGNGKKPLVQRPGEIRCLGVCEEDNQSADGVTIASSFIRVRSHDLRTWLGVPKNKKDPSVAILRTQPDDVVLWVFPTAYRTAGSSASIASLLALLKMYFKDLRLKPRIAMTGLLTLCGLIHKVAGVILKV